MIDTETKVAYDDVTKKSSSVTGFSLDLINGDSRRSNLFHLSNVELVDLRGNEGDFEKAWNSRDEEDEDVNNIEGENKLRHESVESYGIELKKSVNLLRENFLMKQDDFPSYDDEKYENDGKEASLEGGGTARISGKVSIKSTIASDIEKAMERQELENVYEISSSAETIFEESEIFQEITLMEDTPRLMMSQYERRGKLIGAAGERSTVKGPSILEQRLKIIASLKELLQERKMLKLRNSFLNKKCCLFLDKCTPAVIGQRLFESIGEASGSSPLPIHLNQRYEAVLEEFMVIQSHYDNARPILVDESEELKNSYETLRDIFNEALSDLMERELIIGSNCIDGKTGKLVNGQKIRCLMKKQKGKFDQLSKIRVHYLKLNNSFSLIKTKLRRFNMIMDNTSPPNNQTHYEDVVHPNDGRLLMMHGSPTLMDYEQLMMVNNSLIDKMDERDQELRKLRDKCTESISIFSHMKESWDILSCDITSTASKLEETIEIKDKARALLAIQGSMRDSLRKDISRIRHAPATGGRLLLELNPILLKKMNNHSQALEIFKLRVQTS